MARTAPQGDGSAEAGYLRSAGLISGLTLLSRILGLARDVLTTALFGTGLLLDAFYLAFTIPNLFRKLFGEGALTAAFIPVYTEVQATGGQAAASRLAGAVGTLLVLLLGLLVAFGAGAATFAAAGLEASPDDALALELARTMLPYLVLVCLTALMASILQSHRHFLAPAAAPILFNLVWLAGLALLVGEAADAPRTAIGHLAALVLVAGCGQVALLAVPLARLGLGLRPRLAPGDADVRRVASLMVPTLLGLAVLQLNVLTDRLVAWFLVPDAGAITILYLANRLIQFPLALIAIAIGTAVFPALARLAASGRTDERRATLAEALEVTIFLALPSAVGLALLARPIVGLLFERGAFDATATRRTALVLAAYAVGLVGASVSILLTRALQAAGDARTPVRIACVAVAVNAALDLALVGPLAEVGLALATAAAALVQMILLLVADRSGDAPVDGRRLARSVGRSTLLSAAMAGAVVATGRFDLGRVGDVAVAVAVGVAVHAGLAAALRVPEWTCILERFQGPKEST